MRSLETLGSIINTLKEILLSTGLVEISFPNLQILCSNSIEFVGEYQTTVGSRKLSKGETEIEICLWLGEKFSIQQMGIKMPKIKHKHFG